VIIENYKYAIGCSGGQSAGFCGKGKVGMLLMRKERTRSFEAATLQHNALEKKDFNENSNYRIKYWNSGKSQEALPKATALSHNL
jgi:hypothetical protein